jgi:hypothetical protein
VIAATEREIEDAGCALDWATASAVLHQRQCRTRQRGLDCLKCFQLDAEEFAASSRYEALVLLAASADRPHVRLLPI